MPCSHPPPDEIAEARQARYWAEIGDKDDTSAGEGEGTGDSPDESLSGGSDADPWTDRDEGQLPLPRSEAPAPARCCEPGLLAFKENRP